MPISLCDLIYKFISKVIANRLKGILSTIVSIEQVGLVFNRKILDAIGYVQEGLHSIKSCKDPTIVIKLDLKKII